MPWRPRSVLFCSLSSTVPHCSFGSPSSFQYRSSSGVAGAAALPWPQPCPRAHQRTRTNACHRDVTAMLPPKEWIRASIPLWESVGYTACCCALVTSERANSRAFRCLLGCEFSRPALAHGLLSLRSNAVQKRLASRGGRIPNLDWDSGFGGSVLRKGGLAPAPFFILGPVVFRWLARGSRGGPSFLSEGAKHRARLPAAFPCSQPIKPA